jgi:hypothetical protein
MDMDDENSHSGVPKNGLAWRIKFQHSQRCLELDLLRTMSNKWQEMKLEDGWRGERRLWPRDVWKPSRGCCWAGSLSLPLWTACCLLVLAERSSTPTSALHMHASSALSSSSPSLLPLLQLSSLFYSFHCSHASPLPYLVTTTSIMSWPHPCLFFSELYDPSADLNISLIGMANHIYYIWRTLDTT